MAEGGGLTMRLREIFGARAKTTDGVPKVATVDEAIKLTSNGHASQVEVKGPIEPFKPTIEDVQKPKAIDPGDINNQTILTATKDQSVKEMVDFLNGSANPNIEPPKSNGSPNGK